MTFDLCHVHSTLCADSQLRTTITPFATDRDLILCHPTKHPYLLQTEGYIYFQCSKALAVPNLLQSPSAWGFMPTSKMPTITNYSIIIYWHHSLSKLYSLQSSVCTYVQYSGWSSTQAKTTTNGFCLFTS